MNNKKNIIKIGIFTVFIAAITIWGIKYLKNEKVFSTNKIYYAEYQNVKGLRASSTVLINGLAVGKVSDIRFKDDNSGHLIVELSIERKFKIPKNSTAKISSLDLMGTQGIRIIRSTNSEFLQSGDTLNTSVETSLTEILSQAIIPLQGKAEVLMTSVDSIAVALNEILDQPTRKSIQQSFQSMQQTMQNIQTTSKFLNSKEANLTKIIENVEFVSSMFKDNSSQITQLINNFANITDSATKADISAVLQNANKSITTVSSILEKIDNGNGSLSEIINDDSLYNNLNQSTLKLNELLEDIKQNPKRYINFSVLNINSNKKK